MLSQDFAGISPDIFPVSSEWGKKFSQKFCCFSRVTPVSLAQLDIKTLDDFLLLSLKDNFNYYTLHIQAPKPKPRRAAAPVRGSLKQ